MQRTLISMAAAMAITAAGGPRAWAEVPHPTIEGPITGEGLGNPFVAGTTFDLASVGYVQEEFFISGTATAYTAAGPLDPDGTWTATPGETIAYKTRILVYRPERPKKFKGTVALEWLNVSGGLDSAPDWITGHVEIIRSGMAWVGVSAQFVGVEGGSGGAFQLPLKTINPRRYGSLVHPGDSFSYDMYSQAGQAFRGSAGADLLGGKEAKRVLAMGESQSAFRMVTYVNAVHPLAQVYDGFLVHSRGGGAASLSQPPQPDIEAPTPAFIRTDLDIPVLTFQTETDVTRLGSHAIRQPDTDLLRLWEVAGTAHADTYTLFIGWNDVGDDPTIADVVVSSEPIPGIIQCDSPINSGPQHFVLNTAIWVLDRWVRRGKAPREAPLIETTDGPPVAFVLDEHGNVRGGIRTPWVDVPVATLSGEGQSGGSFCGLFGTTVPFDDATLSALYPTHRAYVSAYKKSTKRALRAGFLRKPDAKLMRKNAAASDIGG